MSISSKLDFGSPSSFSSSTTNSSFSASGSSSKLGNSSPSKYEDNPSSSNPPTSLLSFSSISLSILFASLSKGSNSNNLFNTLLALMLSFCSIYNSLSSFKARMLCLSNLDAISRCFIACSIPFFSLKHLPRTKNPVAYSGCFSIPLSAISIASSKSPSFLNRSAY